ncbi:MAG: esterase-like activity of phytase family protein [Actinomycetota bacterium]
MRRLTLTLVTAVALLATAVAPAGARSRPVDVASIELLGEVTFPTGFEFDGTEVGGLSGAVLDQETGRFVLLSDDRESPRFYEAEIAIDGGAFEDGDVVFTSVTSLTDETGAPVTPFVLDPEGVTIVADGGLLVSSEGDANAGIGPQILEVTRDGQVVGELPVDEKYAPAGESGIRNNLAFESLTLTPNGRRLFTATEGALLQDGPASDLGVSSPVRIAEYRADRLVPRREYVYEVGPVADEPVPADGFRVNGLVELLALDDRGTLLALERSFSVGVGNSVSLYVTSLRGARNVRAIEALDGKRYRTVEKELLLDLGTLGITLDNLEALAFGPTLPDGRESLLVVSDNNFNPDGQFTQFLLFALDLG